MNDYIQQLNVGNNMCFRSKYSASASTMSIVMDVTNSCLFNLTIARNDGATNASVYVISYVAGTPPKVLATAINSNPAITLSVAIDSNDPNKLNLTFNKTYVFVLAYGTAKFTLV